MRRVAPLPPQTIGFTAMRPLKSGVARNYTEIEFDRGWAGADRFLRTLEACGFVKDSSDESCYATLDAIDAEGDIIHTYDLPTRQAFEYVYRILGLRVSSQDGVA